MIAMKLVVHKGIYFWQTCRGDIKKSISPKKNIISNQDLSSVMNSFLKMYMIARPTILFSPGHPSGQDYKNFEERGDHFIKLALRSND
jgi:UDP-N-acetylmuramoylalanine-D-glutamate ligase